MRLGWDEDVSVFGRFGYQTELPACGDERRWPDVFWATDRYYTHVTADKVCTTARIEDEDLRTVVKMAWMNHGTIDDERALANIIDAAVDEQDRRRYTPLRPRRLHTGAVIRSAP